MDERPEEWQSLRMVVVKVSEQDCRPNWLAGFPVPGQHLLPQADGSRSCVYDDQVLPSPNLETSCVATVPDGGRTWHRVSAAYAAKGKGESVTVHSTSPESPRAAVTSI